MFNKKNIAIVFAIAQIAVFCSAMQQNGDVNELFQKLLVSQGTLNPTNRSNMKYLDHNFQPIFDAARSTGLIAQYKTLLLSQSGNDMLSNFIAPAHLQMIAYMQNTYGQGNPFSYDGNGLNVELGTYVGSSNDTIIITRYSFFKGLLDALKSLATDPQSRSNQYFKAMHNEIINNLVTAIANSETQVVTSKFPLLADKAVELIRAGNKDVIKAIGMQVLKPLEKIVSPY